MSKPSEELSEAFWSSFLGVVEAPLFPKDPPPLTPEEALAQHERLHSYYGAPRVLVTLPPPSPDSPLARDLAHAINALRSQEEAQREQTRMRHISTPLGSPDHVFYDSEIEAGELDLRIKAGLGLCSRIPRKG